MDTIPLLPERGESNLPRRHVYKSAGISTMSDWECGQDFLKQAGIHWQETNQEAATAYERLVRKYGLGR